MESVGVRFIHFTPPTAREDACEMRLSVSLLALAVLALVGCAEPSPLLSIDIITDLTPGPEFDLAEVTLFPAGASRTTSGEILRTTIRPTSNADALRFSRGLRIADFAVHNGRRLLGSSLVLARRFGFDVTAAMRFASDRGRPARGR